MRRKKNKHRRFVLLERKTLVSEAWKSLTMPEMIVYIYIKNNYNGTNNGEIPLKYSELTPIMAKTTISRALTGLFKKGWIERIRRGGRFRFFCVYELTGDHDAIV